MNEGEYEIDVSHVPDDIEYKIEQDGEDLINNFSEETLEQVNNGSELVRELLTANEPRITHPHTGETTNHKGEISPRRKAVTVGAIIAPADKIKEIKSNIRIIRK